MMAGYSIATYKHLENLSPHQHHINARIWRKVDKGFFSRSYFGSAIDRTKWLMIHQVDHTITKDIVLKK